MSVPSDEVPSDRVPSDRVPLDEREAYQLFPASGAPQPLRFDTLVGDGERCRGQGGVPPEADLPAGLGDIDEAEGQLIDTQR